ncbi:UPF0755 protein [Desulfitispora alkaliphila]|uniref:endolytic transglycosylase MltG n=1 Tax=Desulfitispora alkaliphila TaxID=622674 RepID=UPI003D24F59A
MNPTTENKGVRNTKPIVKILVIIVLVMAVALAIIALFGYNYYTTGLSPVSPEGEEVHVEIPMGASTHKIAEILEGEKLIKDPVIFRLYSRFNGYDGNFKAGEYEFCKSMSVQEIAEKIVAGDVVIYQFTIPEGLTLVQIAQRLHDKEIVDKEHFLNATQEVAVPFEAELLQGEKRLEGFLFPDTYTYTTNMGEEEIVKMMLNRFNTVFDEEMLSQMEEVGLSILDVVTIASLIEREAKVDQDRPKIAGVIFNRLRIGKALQIDATVQYALPEHKERLLYRDLEVDSPYNTYKYPGLPPSPIAAPGEKSIRAVLEPAEHDYLYYVLKPDGSHYFSKTYGEHLNARNRYLR